VYPCWFVLDDKRKETKSTPTCELPTALPWSPRVSHRASNLRRPLHSSKEGNARIYETREKQQTKNTTTQTCVSRVNHNVQVRSHGKDLRIHLVRDGSVVARVVEVARNAIGPRPRDLKKPWTTFYHFFFCLKPWREQREWLGEWQDCSKNWAFRLLQCKEHFRSEMTHTFQQFRREYSTHNKTPHISINVIQVVVRKQSVHPISCEKQARKKHAVLLVKIICAGSRLSGIVWIVELTARIVGNVAKGR